MCYEIASSASGLLAMTNRTLCKGLSRFLNKFQWYYFLLISGQSEGCQEENQKYRKGRINKTRIFYLTDPCHQSGRITTTKILNGKGTFLQKLWPV
jgi:hypothetical protein